MKSYLIFVFLCIAYVIYVTMFFTKLQYVSYFSSFESILGCCSYLWFARMFRISFDFHNFTFYDNLMILPRAFRSSMISSFEWGHNCDLFHLFVEVEKLFSCSPPLFYCSEQDILLIHCGLSYYHIFGVANNMWKQLRALDTTPAPNVAFYGG